MNDQIKSSLRVLKFHPDEFSTDVSVYIEAYGTYESSFADQGNEL